MPLSVKSLKRRVDRKSELKDIGQENRTLVDHSICRKGGCAMLLLSSVSR